MHLLKHTTICHIELKEKMLERQVFEFADAIVINTPVMRDNSVKDNPDLEHKFHVIPNGFDREDFEGIEVGIEKIESLH